MSNNHYELKKNDTGYFIFDGFMITLDFFPGAPRIQVEDEQGELVQELSWDEKDKKFT